MSHNVFFVIKFFINNPRYLLLDTNERGSSFNMIPGTYKLDNFFGLKQIHLVLLSLNIYIYIGFFNDKIREHLSSLIHQSLNKCKLPKLSKYSGVFIKKSKRISNFLQHYTLYMRYLKFKTYLAVDVFV